MAVYLLHFDPPYKHARHYLGFSNHLDQRIKQHFHGHGSRLVKVVLSQGISVKVARVWEDGDRALEQKIKRRNNNTEYCPICRGDQAVKPRGYK